jgi:hypothetical protein
MGVAKMRGLEGRERREGGAMDRQVDDAATATLHCLSARCLMTICWSIQMAVHCRCRRRTSGPSRSVVVSHLPAMYKRPSRRRS